ncbi:MAG: hypothetical protein JXK08_09965 [Flavobacteriaceae bacterium]|nr:hypothetical protein [Flavobacteriaceae bacterium]
MEQFINPTKDIAINLSCIEAFYYNEKKDCLYIFVKDTFSYFSSRKYKFKNVKKNSRLIRIKNMFIDDYSRRLMPAKQQK